MINVTNLYSTIKEQSVEVQEGEDLYTVKVDIYGTRKWYLYGTLNRKKGPAVDHLNGSFAYYREGLLHRSDGPAVVNEFGKFFYEKGRLHNSNGPAVIYSDGSTYWFVNGVIHRDNGPAIETDTRQLWVINGVITQTKNLNKAQMSPKTQKAKSILFGCSELQEQSSYIYSLRGYGTKSLILKDPLLITNKQDIAKIPADFWQDKKIFARPCPKVPKHGFVDSRLISSKDELKSLLKEVLDEDPQGEIVLTNFLDGAVCSAVLTTGGTVSIGPGHNGATAGKNSFSFPVKPEELPMSVRKKAGVVKYDNQFIETVFTKPVGWVESFHYTQVRGGPAIAATKDFIPKKVVVKKVVAPNDDLVAWEKEVKKFAAGTVVYGPGHTLASHAAIHCVINNIPFVTSFAPKVGQTLVPSSNEKVTFSQRDFKVGFTLGIDNSIEIHKMLHTSAAILHNWAYLRTSEHASWMLGLGTAYFIKVLCALNFGEYRYANSNTKLDRDTVYKNLLSSPKFGNYIRRSPKVARDFKNTSIFKPGFGGAKWAKAAYMSVDIWNLASKIFQTSFKAEDAKQLIKALNKAVNLVHNNGWLFNKISEQPLLNYIAEHPGLAILQMSDVLYKNYKLRKTLRRLRNVNRVIYSK